MKVRSIWKYVTLLFVLTALVGCPLFGPDIVAPDPPTVTVGNEQLTIAWTAAPGASEYLLYSSDDGTVVTTASTEAYRGTATSFDHTGLESSKSYSYVLRYQTADGWSDLSAETGGNRPDPVLRVNVTFAGYASDDVGYRLLHLADGDTSDVLERTDGSTTTNGTGLAQIQMLPTRGNWYGISVFKDEDASGTLSPGDTVWGAGGGSYSYFSYDATKPIGDSVTITIDDWDTYEGTAINIF